MEKWTEKLLVGYATRYDSTQEVAQALAETLRQGGMEVDLKPLSEVRTLTGYRAVVMGAPLFMFHSPLHDPHDTQESKPSATHLEGALHLAVGNRLAWIRERKPLLMDRW